MSEERIQAALRVARNFGGTDGAHHKMWVVDQMVRHLTGCQLVEKVNPTAVGGPHRYLGLGESEDYQQWVAGTRDGEDGPETYDWDTGIAP